MLNKWHRYSQYNSDIFIFILLVFGVRLDMAARIVFLDKIGFNLFVNYKMI